MTSLLGKIDVRAHTWQEGATSLDFNGAHSKGSLLTFWARAEALYSQSLRLHDSLAVRLARLVVRQNLVLGEKRRKATSRWSMDDMFQLFPRLRERARQLAGSMSGGEQQMLALARALMSAPRILLVDEPSVGLAPLLVQRTIDKIKELKEGFQLTVLMAEQNFPQALRIADRGYVIVHGRIAFEGRSADELNNNDLIRKFYLGL